MNVSALSPMEAVAEYHRLERTGGTAASMPFSQRYVDGASEDDAAAFLEALEAKWSGADPIPAVGDRVTINVNRIGAGTVAGYFTEGGWLGVAVSLDAPFKGNAKVHAFGAEVRPIAA